MKSSFDDMAPEEIYRHVRYPKPELEVVTLRVKEDHTFNFDWNKSQKPKVLERLAERYPYQKAVRRSLSPLPEAAWEMEEFVDKAQNIIFNQKASLLIQGNPGVGENSSYQSHF